MKTKLFAVLVLTGFAVFNAPLAIVHAQGTAFTYQGRLHDGAKPANGVYDLTFSLYDTNQALGNLIAGPVTNAVTVISNGLFTAVVDFGAGVFTGTNYWLEIGVQTNGGGGFTALSPRQALTSTPYAITAGNVAAGGLAAGTYGNAMTLDNAANIIAGTFSGDGSGLSSVNAYSVNGLTTDSLWKLGGNAGADPASGAFLGTTDTLPLEFRVNGNRALRLEYGNDPTYGFAPNVIIGASANVVSNGVYGAFIAGGGGGADANHAGGNYASVLGGLGNIASGYAATVMGYFSVASGTYSTAIGYGATASSDSSLAYGFLSKASAVSSMALGVAAKASSYGATAVGSSAAAGGNNCSAFGYEATANGTGSTAIGSATANGNYCIAMGDGAMASGDNSIALGEFSQALHANTFVWSDGTSFASGAADQFLVYATGGVGIGTAATPPGGLEVASGGLAVTGASSPNYPGARGVFIEKATAAGANIGAIYAYNYADAPIHPLSLCLNTPGGNVGVGTTTPTHLFQVGNAYCDGNTWAPSSDRNIKAGFQPVDARTVLAKVAALPITSWHYTNDVATPHVGPMAQDFYAAFNVGADDLHITTTDEGGVALAAIQGLNEKLEEMKAALDRKAAENAALEQRLEKLERMVTGKNGDGR